MIKITALLSLAFFFAVKFFLLNQNSIFSNFLQQMCASLFQGIFFFLRGKCIHHSGNPGGAHHIQVVPPLISSTCL